MQLFGLSLANLTVAALAASAALYAVAEIGRALRARRWPTVDGEYAGTRLVHRLDADGASTDYAYVAYRYQVAGQPYRNDRLRFGPSVAPRSVRPTEDPEPYAPETAAALAARFPRGQPVQVYYNPRDPGDSVLHPAPSATVWVILATAVVFGYAALQSRF